MVDIIMNFLHFWFSMCLCAGVLTSIVVFTKIIMKKFENTQKVLYPLLLIVLMALLPIITIGYVLKYYIYDDEF